MGTPRKRWSKAPDHPGLPGGPSLVGGHVSTFGIASPAASSPVSAEVQHCALPMAPSCGPALRSHGQTPRLGPRSRFWPRKSWEPFQVGDCLGDGCWNDPRNTTKRRFLMISDGRFRSLVIGPGVLSSPCTVWSALATFFSGNAPQNLTQKQSIKERQIAKPTSGVWSQILL